MLSDIGSDGGGYDLVDMYLALPGYDGGRVQEGMKDALRDVFGKNITVSHLKSLGEEGGFCSCLVSVLVSLFVCL